MAVPANKWLAAILLLCFGLCAGPGGAGLGAEVFAMMPTEHQVKAAFLYNFARFTEWPANDAASYKETLTIGVIGADEFAIQPRDVAQFISVLDSFIGDVESHCRRRTQVDHRKSLASIVAANLRDMLAFQ